jgi:hypothetical protein
VILDRSALWSIDAYLEELRGKIGEAVKRAIPKSKVVWLNLTATRYRRGGHYGRLGTTDFLVAFIGRTLLLTDGVPSGWTGERPRFEPLKATRASFC